MTSQALLVAALATPLAGAALIGLSGARPNAREGIGIGSGVALCASLGWLAPRVMTGERPAVTLAEPFEGFPIAFSAEPLGTSFALLASFLWVVTTVYSIGYMRGHGERNQTRFYTFFAVSIAATMGVALADNLLTLFIFYEVLTLATYPLVTHAGGRDAKRGGRVYLGVLIFTSMTFFLLAIVWTAIETGSTRFTPGGAFGDDVPPAVLGLLLALFVFGIGKAAIMPFHRWLPAAMVAPTPVSALLHAVAVVKAGVFSILKIGLYTFGLERLATMPAAGWLTWLAGFTIVAASIVAMRKDDLKARLAYSTVSQLSYVIAGALLANAAAVTGAAMHIAMHAFGKITLFFCAGAILVAAHKKKVSELDGLGHSMPITMGAFLLGSLSIAGLPPLGGTWSKWYLAVGAVEASQFALLGVFLFSTLLNVGYLVSIPVRAFFKAPPPGAAGFREAPPACLAAIVVCAGASVALFVYPQPLFRVAARMAGLF